MQEVEKGVCLFLLDVACVHVKLKHTGIMPRCFDCESFKKFQAEMESEDRRVMDEIDHIRKFGYDRGGV